jgi:hypothetical protein
MRFFEQINPACYTLHIHSKSDQPLLTYPLFQQAVIPDPVPTNYGDWTIIQAMNRLASHAIKDPEVTHVIYLSQACVPLKSFDQVCHFLTPNVSYFNRTPQLQCFPRAASLLTWYKRDWIQKHSQWCILSRKHATCLVYTAPEYMERYQPIQSAEEHCYLTELYRMGESDGICLTPNLAAGATTFTNWKGMEYPWPSENGLKNYNTITVEEWEYLLKSPALFGRKFNAVI